MHRIRLRGPWRAVTPAGEVRIHLPASWQEAFPEGNQPITLRRSFGFPDGIEAGDRLWLDVRASAAVEVSLNGQSLGPLPNGMGRLEVTSHLTDRNELELLLEPPDDRQADLLHVALLIEPAGTE